MKKAILVLTIVLHHLVAHAGYFQVLASTTIEYMCLSDTVQAWDIVTSNHNSMITSTWSFPGATSGSTFNAISYPAPGTYPITLWVHDYLLNADAYDTFSVTVYPMPYVIITTDTVPLTCAGTASIIVTTNVPATINWATPNGYVDGDTVYATSAGAYVPHGITSNPIGAVYCTVADSVDTVRVIPHPLTTDTTTTTPHLTIHAHSTSTGYTQNVIRDTVFGSVNIVQIDSSYILTTIKDTTGTLTDIVRVLNACNNALISATTDTLRSFAVSDTTIDTLHFTYSDTLVNVGISQINSTELRLYPNPFTSDFTVVTDGTFTITLLSLDGRVITQHLCNNRVSVSTEMLPPGSYILSIQSNRLSGYKKITKL